MESIIRKLGSALVALFLGTALLSFFPTVAFALLAATAVRVGSHGDHTSFVIDLSDKAAFSVSVQNHPDRVIIELPEMEWAASPQALEPSSGLVHKYHFGYFAPGVSRIVLDLTRPTEIRKAFMLPPEGSLGWRLVINLAETTPVVKLPANASRQETRPKLQQAIVRHPAFSASASRVPAPRPTSVKAPSKIVEQPRRIPVIAIDPGHGGVDPGATSVGGEFERNITLAMALLLRDKLEKGGRYKAILTRDHDVFISLRERVAIARAAGAELFVSLHADAIASSQTRGLSVYTLSEKSSDKEAAALADRENKVDLIAGIDLSHESAEVTNILINLAQRETMNLSARFSAIAIHELRREVRLLPKSHRFAGFAVLKAPDIPSVLVEMGYLSNEDEERLLRQPAYRAKLTGSLARAVDGFFRPTKTSARP